MSLERQAKHSKRCRVLWRSDAGVREHTRVCETLLEGIKPNHSDHTLRLRRFRNTKPTLETLRRHWSTGYSSHPITAAAEAKSHEFEGFTLLMFPA